MCSTKIKQRKLIWYGHAQRLPNETPAKSVINYIEQNSDVTKLQKGQTTTWLNILEKYFEEIRQMKILINYCRIDLLGDKDVT